MKYVKLSHSYWEVEEINDDTMVVTMKIKKNVARRTIPVEGNEVFEVENPNELDWSDTTYYDNNCDTGWLSPKGKFFGCSYEHHSDQAKMVHGRAGYWELEEEGWVRIGYRDENPGVPYIKYPFGYGNLPTLEQIQYLKAKRYDIEELMFDTKLEKERLRKKRNEGLKVEYSLNENTDTLETT